MTLIIILFGALMLIAGVILIINPENIFGVLHKNYEKPSLHVMAVVVRLVLGVLLIMQSGVSRFPLVIEIIGWLSIAAAVALALIGRHNFKRLMNWALSFTRLFGRLGGLGALVFGAFLIYAFV